MIGIIDYGLGNIQAFANIYKRLNIKAAIVSSRGDLNGADRFILPGVGSFDWAMNRLNDSGMRESLEELVIVKKIPILGICVGMQILANRSEEGSTAGLGWIEGEVKRFDDSGDAQNYLPHMGWNDVQPRDTGSLFRNFGSEWRFYFLHSYYFIPGNEDAILAITDYNGLYTSSVCSENIFGVQFHPEKSHRWGIQLLKNFAEL